MASINVTVPCFKGCWGLFCFQMWFRWVDQCSTGPCWGESKQGRCCRFCRFGPAGGQSLPARCDWRREPRILQQCLPPNRCRSEKLGTRASWVGDSCARAPRGDCFPRALSSTSCVTHVAPAWPQHASIMNKAHLLSHPSARKLPVLSVNFYAKLHVRRSLARAICGQDVRQRESFPQRTGTTWRPGKLWVRIAWLMFPSFVCRQFLLFEGGLERLVCHHRRHLASWSMVRGFARGAKVSGLSFCKPPAVWGDVQPWRGATMARAFGATENEVPAGRQLQAYGGKVMNPKLDGCCYNWHVCGVVNWP